MLRDSRVPARLFAASLIALVFVVAFAVTTALNNRSLDTAVNNQNRELMRVREALHWYQDELKVVRGQRDFWEARGR